LGELGQGVCAQAAVLPTASTKTAIAATMTNLVIASFIDILIFCTLILTSRAFELLNLRGPWRRPRRILNLGDYSSSLRAVQDGAVQDGAVQDARQVGDLSLVTFTEFRPIQTAGWGSRYSELTTAESFTLYR